MVNPNEYERRRQEAAALVIRAKEMGLEMWEDEPGELCIATGFSAAEIEEEFE